MLPLLFLRLLTAPQESRPPDLFESYSQTAPARTATLLGQGGFQSEAARFLLANDLLELGLHGGSISLYENLIESERFGTAAFVGLARARTEGGDFDDLILDARKGPWERMSDDQASESAYRIARACFETGRYAAARRWLDEVSEDSSFGPFAAYLRGQVEYVLGRYGHALLAVEPIFEQRKPATAVQALQRRTAILVGDMLTEIGLYERAVQMLRWPADDGPFARRARLDRIVAHSLAALDRSDFGGAEELSRIIQEEFEGLVEEIDAAVSTEAALDRRTDELVAFHRSRRTAALRREWAEELVTEVRRAERGWSPGRVLEVLWRSLPPVIVYELLTSSGASSPEVPKLSSETHFLLDAGPDRLGRSLRAASLLVDRKPTESCIGAATVNLERRAAAFLLGEAPEPSLDELRTLTGDCTVSESSDLKDRARSALREAILEEADRQRQALRRRRYVLEEAIARARLDRGEQLREERMTR